MLYLSLDWTGASRPWHAVTCCTLKPRLGANLRATGMCMRPAWLMSCTLPDVAAKCRPEPQCRLLKLSRLQPAASQLGPGGDQSHSLRSASQDPGCWH